MNSRVLTPVTIIVGDGVMVLDAWHHRLVDVLVWQALLALLLATLLRPGPPRYVREYGWQLPDGFVLGPAPGKRPWVRPADVFADITANRAAASEQGTMVRRWLWQRRWRSYDWRRAE